MTIEQIILVVAVIIGLFLIFKVVKGIIGFVLAAFFVLIAGYIFYTYYTEKDIPDSIKKELPESMQNGLDKSRNVIINGKNKADTIITINPDKK